ncbi:hypothetical protein IFM89_033212 [Coptis chinensis]|uniref:Uncharacterized protein n=1 Tax=Coptis chinensis TaxID=261450 RepID=A0A835MBD9_9MAGN|nr:hypothetical protein IFM89_033212 [Coptis chinensis]
MISELVDERLPGDRCEVDELKKVIELALTCASSSPGTRPSMADVVVILSGRQLKHMLERPSHVGREDGTNRLVFQTALVSP